MSPTHNCEVCAASFKPKSKTPRFCSRACKAQWQRGRKWGKGKTRHERACAHCGKTFHTVEKTQRFCSAACWYQSGQARELPAHKCPICGETFHPGYADQIHCSKACYTKAQATSRRVASCEKCGTTFETRRAGARFCSHTCAGRSRGVAKALPLGTKRAHPAGYIEIKTGDGPRGWMLEHRHVMAQHLGRPLLRTETVHHGPGGRADNRLENLELWNSAHPRGQRIEDLVKFAHEILELYGTDRQALAHCPTCSCFGGD